MRYLSQFQVFQGVNLQIAEQLYISLHFNETLRVEIIAAKRLLRKRH